MGIRARHGRSSVQRSWARMETTRAEPSPAAGPVYGVNTGFGALADTRVEQDLTTLQGAIAPLARRGYWRAARRPDRPGDPAAARQDAAVQFVGLPERLLELLAVDLLPVVPGKGSVGASGDLAQLAHLAQPPIGEVAVQPGDGPRGRPAEVLAEHGIEAADARPEEGLSLVNGTEPMQALLAFSVRDADLRPVACALSIEALLGTDWPYDERVQIIRPHPASQQRRRRRPAEPWHLPQRPRGAGRLQQALRPGMWSATSSATPAGSSTPSWIRGRQPGGHRAGRRGHDHRELPRRAARLATCSPWRSPSPASASDGWTGTLTASGAAAVPGAGGGHQLRLHARPVHAGSLVSENKVLASVDTIPTSGKQEDHVSMGWTSARSFRRRDRQCRTAWPSRSCAPCRASTCGLRSRHRPARGRGPRRGPGAGADDGGRPRRYPADHGRRRAHPRCCADRQLRILWRPEIASPL